MKKHLKRALLDVFGVVFIALGVAGIFLPFLQGILFIVFGFYLLSLHSITAHRLLDKFKKKYPKVGGTIDKFDHRVRAFFGIEDL